MSLELLEDHQSLTISSQFIVAYKKVRYDNFLELEDKIKNSTFTFDSYYKHISNQNRKIEWLSIRGLLLELGVKNDIRYDKHGKPHFTEGKAHLSISHSIDSIAVSLHQEKAHGIDLQHLTPKIINIRDKFLNADEVKQLRSGDTKELSVYWSMKEALFKLNGKKDIFLKKNIRIDPLEKESEKYHAIGEIYGIESPIRVEMEAVLLGDFVLAYTLIP